MRLLFLCCALQSQAIVPSGPSVMLAVWSYRLVGHEGAGSVPSSRPPSVSLGLGAKTGPCQFWRPVGSWSGAVLRFSFTTGGPGVQARLSACFPSPKSYGRFPGLEVAVTVAACRHRRARAAEWWAWAWSRVVKWLMNGSPTPGPRQARRAETSWLSCPGSLPGVNLSPVHNVCQRRPRHCVRQLLFWTSCWLLRACDC